MGIPNILTLIRLFLVPVFILFFFSNSPNNLINATIVFFIAGITDVLDGYIARKYDLISKWGTVLDPLADKLMLMTTLICLFVKNYIPLWIVLIIGIKEFIMIYAGISLYKKDIVISSDIYGKITTLIFYIGILFMPLNFSISKYFIYIGVFLSIFAFFNYYMKYTRRYKV